ncbi:hypothetical protein L7F22_048265 [Adiantum nelumboides]|nr:hypothetical protein [Adiantum nelumboides]
MEDAADRDALDSWDEDIDTSGDYKKVLYKLMKGMGTDDATLIRVVVTKAEIDMQYIKAEFVRKYHHRLDDMISSDTSRSYKKFLLALIGSNKL